ncbi:hypothetical protein RvY_19635, partial [Ramazzottius varieornatus]
SKVHRQSKMAAFTRIVHFLPFVEQSGKKNDSVLRYQNGIGRSE